MGKSYLSIIIPAYNEAKRLPETLHDIQRKLNIKEIPVRWSNGTFSGVQPSSYLKALSETFKIRWWLWRGEYERKTLLGE